MEGNCGANLSRALADRQRESEEYTEEIAVAAGDRPLGRAIRRAPCPPDGQATGSGPVIPWRVKMARRHGVLIDLRRRWPLRQTQRMLSFRGGYMPHPNK